MVPALYAPRRTLIDRLLAEAATTAGAYFRFGCSAVGLERDQTGRVTGICVRGRDGSVRTERARLVIGADGRHSLVAREAGAANVFDGQSASAFVYGYFQDLPVAGYEWFYRPRVSHLVVYGTCARATWARATDEERRELRALGELIKVSWGRTPSGCRFRR